MPSIRRTSLQLLIGFLFLLIPLFFVLFPYGIEYGVRQWLLKNGEVGTAVKLENVDFNPLTATLSLYNLEVAVDGEMPLQIPELRLPLSIGPLMRRQVEIGAVTMKGVRLLVERPERQLSRIGGILLHGVEGEQELQQDASGRPWSLHIKSLSIRDTEIRYRDARLDTSLKIDELELDRLMSDQPAQPAVLEFHGALDGSPFLLEGDLLPFASEPSLQAMLHIKALQFGRYAGLLPQGISKLEGVYGMASELRIDYTQQQVLKIKQQGSATLKQMLFESESGSVRDDGLAWNGQLRLGLPMEQGPLALDLDGTLQLGPLAFTGGEGMPAVEQQSLTWQGKIGYESATGMSKAGLEGDLSLVGASIRLPDQQGDITQNDLAWKGKLTFEQTAEANEVRLDGSLKLEDLAGRLEALSLDLATAEAQELDLTLRQAEGQGLSLVHRGGIALRELVTKSEDFDLDAPELTWQGETELQKTTSDALSIKAQGELRNTLSALMLTPQELELSYEAADWNGELQVGLGEKLETLRLNGAAGIDALQVKAPGQEYQLAALNGIRFEGLSLDDPEHVVVKNTEIDQLVVGRATSTATEDAAEMPALLQAGSISVKDVAYSSDAGLSVTLLQPSDIQSLIQRDRDGRWNLDRLQAVLGKETAAEEPADSGSNEQQFPVRIQQIAVAGSNQLRFEDKQPEPAFVATLDLKRLQLSKLDSSRPTEMSPFEVEAMVDDKARVDFTGGMAPFAQRLGLHLEGQIEGLPLPPLSSYTGKMLGYSLDSGELNAEVTFNVEAGKVDGMNKLAIYQLEVSPLSEEKMKELNAELSMPLDTALGMLRDKNNTIKLEVPVTGEVNKLQIDPSDAINQAIGRALKKGATTYLAAALFPFGTMLAVMQIAGEEVTRIRLDPIFFEPAAVSISDKDREYLVKIAQILKERPEVHIKVCGRATESDRERLYTNAKEKLAAAAKSKPVPAKSAVVTISEEQLRALAEQRASEIEQYMLTSQGIKGDRLISCQPLLEKEPADAKPRVELLL